MNSRHQLESLLNQPLMAAQKREQSAFVKAAGTKRQVVIFGGGNLGRIVLHGLRQANIEPVAFTDNNQHIWGEIIGGIRVLSPQNAAEVYKRDAVFVIAVWHPSHTSLIACLLDQVQALGCCGVPFPILFWQFPDVFLPYYLWELPSRLLPHKADVLDVFDLLADETSRQVFFSQIQLRLHADFRALPETSSEEQYFPNLFSLTAEECFVDCGAYNGDTIRSLVRASGGRFQKIIAFEVDPSVTPKLRKCIDEIGPRAVMHSAAVTNTTGTLRFAGDGIGGGRISKSEGTEVPCARLNDILANEQPSFIKMDIEGAELDALHGACEIIQRQRPVLAVCAYHSQDHLWNVPRLLHNILPDAAIFMRSHQSDGFDVVCYAIPPERINNNLANLSAANRHLSLSQSGNL